MKYDFTSILDRQGMDAIAVDLPEGFSPYKGDVQLKKGFDLIPMWVADMNFPVPPAITDAIIERAKHPAFGYFEPRQAYYDAIIQWHKTKNGVEDLKPEHIGYENGVLGGVVSALNVFCSKGAKVLVHTPAYIGFTSTLENNGYDMVKSPLVQDQDGIWRMDLADMEAKIKEQKIHAAVFCSPHNPTGRVWERKELEAVMALFQKYNVYVVADEIWSDLILYGNRHIPTQSVSEDAKQRTVALYAPSKTFNLAGLIGSYHIIYNPYLKDRVLKESSLSHYNSMNVLSMHALIGAYSQDGAQWLEELNTVLGENVDYACDFIAQNFKGVTVTKPQGTYMLFLDCSKWCKNHGKTLDQVLNAGYEVGVIWQDGRPFFGTCAIRMNLALPLSRVQEALERLNKYVFS